RPHPGLLARRVTGPTRAGGPGHPQQVPARRGRAAQQGPRRILAGVPGGRPRRHRHLVMSGTVRNGSGAREGTSEAGAVEAGALEAGRLEPRRAQRHRPAAPFAGGRDAREGILRGMVDDVARAGREPLEIFPVCHHSPASATAMARRLRDKQPKVIYLELCEDMAPLLTELRNCTLPVAVQAFASEVDGFPRDWAPLSVVAPITEASAASQALAYP